MWIWMSIASMIFLLWLLNKMARELETVSKSLQETNAALAKANKYLSEPETLAKQYSILMSDQGYPHTVLISGDMAVGENHFYNHECLVFSCFDSENSDEIRLLLAMSGAHTIANKKSPCQIEAAFDDGPILTIAPDYS